MPSSSAGHKTPLACVCLLCARVFKILGLLLKWKGIPKYLASVKGDPEGHRPFMKSLKAYINTLNKDPDCAKELLNKAVVEARTTVDEEERQGTRQIARRTFVVEKTFRDMYEKNFSPEEMPEKDTCTVSKKLGPQAGFWLPGSVNNHLPGHYEFEDYQDVSVSFKRRHDGGNLTLSKDQHADKFEAIGKVQNVERSRAESKIANMSADALLRTGPLILL